MMADDAPDPQHERDRDAIERHVQHHVTVASDALDQLMLAITRWQESLTTGDPIEADRWMADAERRFKAASREAQNASILRRQAESGQLRVGPGGSINVGGV
jgi:hypothetical protein